MLLLQRKLTTPNDAVDVFNEHLTKKNLTILQQTEMLWIISMFKIENDITETVIPEYDALISALNPKDTRNQFYISSDKAYMFYVMGEYASAISAYNLLISYAQANSKTFANELKTLYAERGFAKRRIGDTIGAQADFANSGINITDLAKYEPSYQNQEFIVDY